MAGFPSRAIAERSFSYRTLGLGYANLGSILMKWGIPIRFTLKPLSICGAITAMMTGEAYATSAEMAAELGPFKAYPRNQRCHAESRYSESPSMQPTILRKKITKRLSIVPESGFRPNTVLRRSFDLLLEQAWDRALKLGEGARIPKCSSDGHRADRNHWAGHGL